MEIDSAPAAALPAAVAAAPAPAAAVSVPVTSSSSSSSSAPLAMDVDSGSNPHLRTQLKTISVSQKGASTSAEGVLRHLLKMLSLLKKSPNLLATRKFRADNIAVKKFVMDVPGALEIARYVGFQTLELTDKKTPFLIVEEAVLATPEAKVKLDEAIEAVGAAVAVFDAPASAPKPAVEAVRKMCEGKCGFFGSPETEGYCRLEQQQRMQACTCDRCLTVGMVTHIAAFL